ncbi:MAG TPA: hypothetical protein VF070_39030 [Streptosporangiaceae bacterium]
MSNVDVPRDRLLSVINRGAAVVVADMTGTRSCDHAAMDAIARAGSGQRGATAAGGHRSGDQGAHRSYRADYGQDPRSRPMGDRARLAPA